MRVAKSGRLRVVLCVLGLVVASGGAGVAFAADRAVPDRAVPDAVGDAADHTVGDDAPADEPATGDEPLGEPADGLAQAENDTADNDSLASVGIPSVSVVVGGTNVSAETILLTVRKGTGALFVKTLTTRNPDEDASITNLRLAVGERFWQRLRSGSPGVEGAQYTVSFGRFAVGDVRFRLGTRVVRGVIGGTPRTAGPGEGPETTRPQRSFEVVNFSAPENATLGEGYTVSARLTNPGSDNGTEVVRYVFGDVVLGRRIVQLGPNESATVSYQVSPAPLPDSPGLYTHGVQAFDSNATEPIRLVAQNASAANGSAANATQPPRGR